MFLRLLAPAFALTTCLLFSNQAKAQITDSAYFNLGRVKLLKSSTQHVTVKAADLEKFPFANLSEAINVWFSGYFSDASTLVYVIDGNLATDANQYPIYDIDEITLVQNAVAQLNGISQQQQLIVVTTKRNSSGKSGVMFAGQANLVKLQTNRSGSAITNGGSSLYQQYHISAYKNIDQLHFGVSANYLRDVMPSATFNARTDLDNSTLKRWRFNGYLNTSLWKGTFLDLTAGYAPQRNAQASKTRSASSAVSQTEINGDEDLFNGSLNLHSKLLPGLTNEVRTVYNNIDLNNNTASFATIPNGTGNTMFVNTSNSDNKLKNISIYEELRYAKTAGDFTFSPAINLNYRNIKNSTSNRSGNNAGSYSFNTSEFSSKTYLLTPTLALGFKNALNLTAGLVHILNSSTNFPPDKPKKTFPFVTASANISRLIDTTLQANIKVFGSYAVSNLFNDSRSALSSINPFGATNYNTTLFVSNSGSFNYLYGHTFKTLSLGITAGLLHNKLDLNYNYENRNSISKVIYYIYSNNSYPYTYIYLADTKYKLHRISAGFNLLKKDNIQWKTQINVTNFKQYVNAPRGNFIYPAWTGGFTNRLQYKNLTGGMDVQYLFGKNNYPQAAIQSLDSFALQNLYIGWQVKTAKAKSLEIFANGRNITQNKNSMLPDYRRYLGLGVQAIF